LNPLVPIMGQIRPHYPVVLLLAAFSRHEAALDWARQQASRCWGSVQLASDVFDFDNTGYYQSSMGTGLKKVLLAFADLVDPAMLADVKLQTNAWESLYRQQSGHAEPRPLNLDPGYVTEAKLVLATTKDRDHRLYLRQGIYAEVTLYYQRDRGWQSRDWTYPDYRSPACHEFLTRCRNFLRENKHAV
jgi:hypothetical protein